MSSKTTPITDFSKLDYKTLNKVYYSRALFGVIAGCLSGLLPPLFSPISLIILMIMLIVSNGFAKKYILHYKIEPPFRFGIGVYILGWLVFLILIATLMKYTLWQTLI
ncbi:MAG: hypothetical protein RQ922_01885 [Thermoproteota archaeon]|nr:hypothetical protein [Thermoproteota archaeon]